MSDLKPHDDSEPCPNGPCVACGGTGWVGPNYRRNRNLPPYRPTSESVPVLSTEEEARFREGLPRWPDPFPREPLLRVFATLDAERTASAARIEALEGALRGIAALQPIGPFRVPTSELQAAQVIARAALTSEAHRDGPDRHGPVYGSEAHRG